jgi:hypothetical protein
MPLMVDWALVVVVAGAAFVIVRALDRLSEGILALRASGERYFSAHESWERQRRADIRAAAETAAPPSESEIALDKLRRKLAEDPELIAALAAFQADLDSFGDPR